MMKRAGVVIGSLLQLWAVTACKKVIDVTTSSSDKKYVIEGKLNNAGTCSVLVSTTEDFDSDTIFEGVDSAVITVREEAGDAITLHQKSKGAYYASFAGKPGKTYYLTVHVNGFVFTASSTMPQQVNMNSLYASLQAVAGKSQYVAGVNYSDPANVANYYNFIQVINRKTAGTIFLNNDDLTNGNTINFPLLFQGTLTDSYSTDLNKGDSLQVEMQCIDAAVYKYWYSLQSGASGESVISTPANPVTNITGGALGYFSAYTSQTKKIVVQ